MLAWAQELQLGTWFTLDHNGRISQVQFAWRSDRKQLHLFASADGRSFLIQARRLAAYLQAGLLVPTEEEALTVRATRDALAKLDANPERLLRSRGGLDQPGPRTGFASPQAQRPRRQDYAQRRLAQWHAVRVVAEFVEHQRVRLLAETPVHHQHDDLQVVQRQRVAGRGHGAVHHDLAHVRRQHAGGFEEAR